ncbi:hypothetical protein O1L60_10555 [Streptomyces diastatochromogenes]|nr:hypothetical protein [Streptomyces diastatochromogenes]
MAMIPALLTSRSTVPKRVYAVSARASTEAGSATSVTTAATSAPVADSSPANSASRSAAMSARTSFMPSPAACRARPAPIPEEAPVMTAVRPPKTSAADIRSASRRRCGPRCR